LNVYYGAEHAESPVVLASPDEIDKLFGELRESYPVGSAVLLTVVLADDPWGPELTVGVDGDKGVLRYAGDSDPSGVYSRSPTPTNAGPVVYYFVTADTEFPPNAEVPLPAVQAAMREYLSSVGQRPTAVGWQVSGSS
jgi:hypothetical protein